MKLSDVKDKIDEYFDSHTEEEVLEALERHRAIEISDNMKEKELNFYELLKGCEGETFYSLLHGDVLLEEVIPSDIIDEDGDVETPAGIYFIINKKLTSTYISLDGRWDERWKGVVIFYPSRALYEKYPLDPYSAWMEWKEARKPKRWRAEKGECYWFFDRTYTPYQQEENDDIEDEIMYDAYNYFRTEEEAQQAAEIVKEALHKFHEQNNEKNNTL